MLAIAVVRDRVAAHGSYRPNWVDTREHNYGTDAPSNGKPDETVDGFDISPSIVRATSFRPMVSERASMHSLRQAAT